MKNHGTETGFRVHHHAFGQAYADFRGLQKLPQTLLIVEIRARRIAEAVTLAAITGGESRLHCHIAGIGETPVFAEPSVQPLRAGLGGFEREGLQGMRE